MKKTEEGKIKEITSCLAFVFLGVYFFDCAFSGNGRWIEFGPIGIRMLLIIITMILASYFVVANLREIISNRFFKCLVIFGIAVILSTIFGILKHNDLRIMAIDVKGLAYFAVFPFFYVILSSEKRIKYIFEIINIGAFCTGLLSIFIYIIYGLVRNFDMIHYNTKMSTSFVNIEVVSSTVLRVFPYSTVFVIAGMAYSLFRLSLANKRRWFYIITVSVELVEVLFTYTRSLYLAAIVTILLVLFFYIRYKICSFKAFVLRAASIVAVCLVVLTVVGFANRSSAVQYIMYGINRSAVSINFGDSKPSVGEGHEKTGETTYLEMTQSSDDLRELTINGLLKSIKKSPLIGHGMGIYSEERGGLTEYFYLDLWNKMGLIGLILYFMPLLLIMGLVWKKRVYNIQNELYPFAAFSALVGFCVFSLFLPCMNAGDGISMYCLTMVLFSQIKMSLKKKRMVEEDQETDELVRRFNRCTFRGLEHIKCGDALYFVLSSSEIEQMRQMSILKAVLRVLRGSVTNAVRYSEDALVRVGIVFSNSYAGRNDYKVWFQKVLDTCDKKIAILPDNRKITLKNLKYIPYFFHWIKDIGKAETDYRTNMVVISVLYEAFVDYMNIIQRLEPIDLRLLVVLCDTHLIDSLLVQHYNQKGIDTATLQHGSFSASWVLSASQSKYFMAHGQFTREQCLRANMKDERICLLGMPHQIGEKRYHELAVHHTKNIGIIFCGRKYAADDIRILETALKFAQQNNYKIYVKLHPGYGKEEYVYKNWNLVDKIYSDEISVEQFTEMIDFSLTAGSTVFVEYIMKAFPVFIFDGEYKIYDSVQWCKFKDEKELEHLVNVLMSDKSEFLYQVEKTQAYFCAGEDVEENYKKFFKQYTI